MSSSFTWRLFFSLLLSPLFVYHPSTNYALSQEKEEKEEEELDDLAKERLEKEKEQQKRDKQFNEEKLYKFMVGRDVLTIRLCYHTRPTLYRANDRCVYICHSWHCSRKLDRSGRALPSMDTYSSHCQGML